MISFLGAVSYLQSFLQIVFPESIMFMNLTVTKQERSKSIGNWLQNSKKEYRKMRREVKTNIKICNKGPHQANDPKLHECILYRYRSLPKKFEYRKRRNDHKIAWKREIMQKVVFQNSDNTAWLNFFTPLTNKLITVGKGVIRPHFCCL